MAQGYGLYSSTFTLRSVPLHLVSWGILSLRGWLCHVAKAISKCGLVVLDGAGRPYPVYIIVFGNSRVPLKGRCSVLRDVTPEKDRQRNVVSHPPG